MFQKGNKNDTKGDFKTKLNFLQPHVYIQAFLQLHPCFLKIKGKKRKRKLYSLEHWRQESFTFANLQF